jgi:putative membrane protein
MSVAEPKSANDLANERTDLAIERTVMASGRTLMGWVRTALSMISFGFTIYKFMDAAVKSIDAISKTKGPRRLGLFLIAMGVFSIVCGTVEYYQTVQRMNRLSTRHYKVVNFTLIIGALIGLLGLFLFVTILTRTEVF